MASAVARPKTGKRKTRRYVLLRQKKKPEKVITSLIRCHFHFRYNAPPYLSAAVRGAVRPSVRPYLIGSKGHFK